jgi:type VI secretion system protein ImpM
MSTDTLHAQAAGWYGKLPSRGDFVGRGLPRAWFRLWEDWLQRGLARATAELGATTVRERLLEMPPWQFIVLASAPAQPVWCGIVLASADRIGRAFPMLVAEAFDAAAVDAACLTQLHDRALGLRDWALAAAKTASPKEFEAGLVARAASPWRSVPAAAAGGGETLGALRSACPNAASFWWCAAPADIMVPPVPESWPPQERLIFDWLGEGD